jgi:2-haloacid dehalogenase/putative hydrolase of the HAD superfamily
MIRALLLDFYGTLVAEDDPIVAEICAKVHATADRDCQPRQVGTHWWAEFRADMATSFGPDFITQRAIAVSSLSRTLAHFGSPLDAARLCAPQFDFWQRPELFPESRDFLAALDIPVCVVSNIDRADVLAAIGYHRLPLETVLTSEDVRAYKPRVEIFAAALERLGRRPDEVLQVGDSLTADIGGAHALGIPAVWVNRAGKPVPDGFTGVSVVTSLSGIRPLIG